MIKKSSCLCILSGGQDSTTCLFLAKKQFDEVHAITFDYGQRHCIEIKAAEKVGRLAKVASHVFFKVPGILKSCSPLTGSVELEQYENAQQMETVIGKRVELTFVPMRNTFFFTIAMNHAIVLNCHNLITGICQEDNANYPDCTENFREAFESMANMSLGINDKNSIDYFKLLAPLMYYSKADTVQLMRSLGQEAWGALAYTHTSYDGKYPPTDMNHANVLRASGFEKAGLPDPLVLRAVSEGLMELPLTANYK